MSPLAESSAKVEGPLPTVIVAAMSLGEVLIVELIRQDHYFAARCQCQRE